MKRGLIFLLAATLLLMPVACGDTPSTSSAVSHDEPNSISSTTSETQTSASSNAYTSATQSTSTTAPSTSKTTTTSTRRTAMTTTTTTTTKPKPAYQTLPKTNLYGTSANANKEGFVYRLGDEGAMLNTSGLTVREVNIKVGLGNDPLEIVQISDAHIGYNTLSKMRWKNCLHYAQNFDYMVLTGDMIEGLTDALAGYYKDSIDPYDNVMMTLGNHEWIKGEDSCPEDMDARYKKLQGYFKNDVYYSSVILKNKVMLIQMDNSQEKFWDHQIPKLQKDLDAARSQGYAVLLFIHVPLGTNNPSETDVNAIYSTDTPAHSQHVSFVNLAPGPKSTDPGTKTVYEIITNSADVIKGVFGGHMHSHFYTEICAKTPDGTDAVIPQYVSHKANFDGGHVLKINLI